MMDAIRIGYVGLGNMGTQMCSNLGKLAQKNAYPPLSIWNRSPDKYSGVKADCPDAHYAAFPREVVQRSDVIFTCLLNDKVAQLVYGQLCQGDATGKIFVDQSSLSPTTTKQLDDRARGCGAVYLSSPVFGPPAVAKSAQLLLVLAGESAAKAKVKPLLVPAVGKAVLDVGDEAVKGSTMKLLGNTCILGTIELLGEAYALADSVDFDPAVFQDFIRQWFPAPAWMNYGTKIGKGTFAGGNGFRIEGGLKDARNILSLGADLGHPCPVPTIETAAKNLERASEIGGQDMDWSSLAITLRENAGLEPFRGGGDQGKSVANGH